MAAGFLIMQTAAAQEYASGAPVKEVLEKYGISMGSLYYAVDRLGIKKRGWSKFDCNEGLFKEETEVGKYWLGFCSADAHAEEVPERAKFNIQLKLARADKDATVYMLRKRKAFQF